MAVVASVAGKVVVVCCSASHHHGMDESFGVSGAALRNEAPTRYACSWGSLTSMRKPTVRLDGGGGFASCSGISLSSSTSSSRNLSSSEGGSLPAVFGRRKSKARRGSEGIFAASSSRGGTGEPSRPESTSIFEVADPRVQGSSPRAGAVDLTQALELLWQDVLYLDYRARQDVLAIKSAHDKVVEVLNPLAREQNSVMARREQLAQLQEELAQAHTQVHLSEARVEHSLRKLAEIEAAINKKLLFAATTDATKVTNLKTVATAADESTGVVADSRLALTERPSKKLNVSGPTAPYHNRLKNFWYPVAFSSNISADTMIPFESFEQPWVLFRGADGRPGCVQDECAHRACPLSLGRVVDGQIQCPYHGWEYATDGECKKMPSTKSLKATINSLPCIEQDGMVWIWPGDETPSAALPCLNPPSNFTIHAEIVLELPVEHGLLMENLLDLAHAPFTHTSTFAKGWSVPNFVRFKTPTSALSGYWDPYPIDMEFQPPCMVLSTIGLVKPGQLDLASAQACQKHLHQLHVCMPSTRGKTRLLYRMALDFAQWAKYVPFITKLWVHLANQVLNEDLRLVEGQQDRMKRGGNVWETPVAYDKLGVRYRRWRNAVEEGNERIFDSGLSEGS